MRTGIITGLVRYSDFRSKSPVIIPILGDQGFLPRRDPDWLKLAPTQDKAFILMGGAAHISHVLDDNKPGYSERFKGLRLFFNVTLAYHVSQNSSSGTQVIMPSAHEAHSALEKLPKVELHCHLEACFRRQTMMALGASLGLDAPQNVKEFCAEWLLTEPEKNLAVALQKFSNIQSVWANESIIERLTYEACEYGYNQGIKIFELRYSPDFIAAGHPELTFDKIHRAIVAGIERASHLDIAVGLIGIVQKTLPTKQAAYTGDFIAAHNDTFVGIDMADQDIGDEIMRFAPIIEKARAAGLHFTTHAGEEPVPDAPRHVYEAIEHLGAERIGHGIHIIRDSAVMDYVIEKGVMLEVCPTSNWLTSSVPSTAEHPVRRLMEAGVQVSINSDDPGLFDIDLCHEYALMQSEHNFSVAEFDRCNDLAASHSFIAPERKQAVWPRPIE
ncbi:MAG: adenosine deaminase [Gammaproteobacteria bacterium]|nr:adenosine deaminase [Gammaproteobacteria bacterium]MBT5792360.1 adenosine deaminase [Gammaproteobacteria bacterium]MBT7795621.1 adenosine deaminase [Gammaproteobacteria bacterium]